MIPDANASLKCRNKISIKYKIMCIKFFHTDFAFEKIASPFPEKNMIQETMREL